jgi:hypothetical protein
MKVGDQFLMVNPFTKTDDVIVCVCVCEDGSSEFTEYHDGKIFPASVHFKQKDIENDAGCFNLRPINDKHPAYVKDWKDNPLVDCMAMIEKMFAGKTDEEIEAEVTKQLEGLEMSRPKKSSRKRSNR